MSRFVLDCSIAAAWTFPDECGQYALSVHDCLVENEAVVPAVWTLEYVNALIVAERRQRIAASDTVGFLDAARNLPIQVEHEMSEAAVDKILALARKHCLSSYDAAYLELAQRRALPLATLDDKLKSAARKEGIELFEPQVRSGT